MNPTHGEYMTDNELKTILIQQYADLLRIKTAENRDHELFWQEQVLKAKLQVLGVSAENLEI